MMIPTKIVHLLSGGLDSVCLLYDLIQQGCNVHCLLFRYGQRHDIELRYAREHCRKTKTPFTEVELSQIKGLFLHSALTDGKGSNIVPNRNAVFLHIAASIAASNDAESVTIGCNKDDEVAFPDCRTSFIQSVNLSLIQAQIRVEVCAPYIEMTKRQIVEKARANRWPCEDSISCYSGNSCGVCDACIKRCNALI